MFKANFEYGSNFVSMEMDELFYINGGSGSNGSCSQNGVGNSWSVTMNNCNNCVVTVTNNSGNGVGNTSAGSSSSSGGGGK